MSVDRHQMSETITHIPNALTPYDTGEVLEPHVWNTAGLERLNWGRVDFDDNEGSTVVTIQVAPNDPLPLTGEQHVIIISGSADDYIIQFDEE